VAAATTSVVLVVHNQPELTQACVESLQATRGPFELCIVDNASGEDTVDYLDRLARAVPLRYLRNDENVGLIRALNQGRSSPPETCSASCTTTPSCGTRSGWSACRARWRRPRTSGWPAFTE